MLEGPISRVLPGGGGVEAHDIVAGTVARNPDSDVFKVAQPLVNSTTSSQSPGNGKPEIVSLKSPLASVVVSNWPVTG